MSFGCRVSVWFATTDACSIMMVVGDVGALWAHTRTRVLNHPLPLVAMAWHPLQPSAPFRSHLTTPHQSPCQHQQLHSLILDLDHLIRFLPATLQSRLALCQRGLWWWRVGTSCYVARSVEVIFSSPANVDPQFSLYFLVSRRP